jgi:hypothetical protein
VENTGDELVQGIAIRLRCRFGEKFLAWTPPPSVLSDPEHWPYFAPGEVHTVEVQDDPQCTGGVTEVTVMGVRYENGLGWTRVDDPTMRGALQRELRRIENG